MLSLPGGEGQQNPSGKDGSHNENERKSRQHQLVRIQEFEQGKAAKRISSGYTGKRN